MDDDQKACPYCGCTDAHWVEVKQWDCENVGGCSIQTYNELERLRKALIELRDAARNVGDQLSHDFVDRVASEALEDKERRRCEAVKDEMRCDLEAGHTESHHAIERMDTTQW